MTWHNISRKAQKGGGTSNRTLTLEDIIYYLIFVLPIPDLLRLEISKIPWGDVSRLSGLLEREKTSIWHLKQEIDPIPSEVCFIHYPLTTHFSSYWSRHTLTNNIRSKKNDMNSRFRTLTLFYRYNLHPDTNECETCSPTSL